MPVAQTTPYGLAVTVPLAYERAVELAPDDVRAVRERCNGDVDDENE